MKKKFFRPLMKKVKTIEKNWDSLEEFVVFSTFGQLSHRMKIRDEILYDESLLKVYKSLSDLEQAEFYDLQKLSEENGKFG